MSLRYRSALLATLALTLLVSSCDNSSSDSSGGDSLFVFSPEITPFATDALIVAPRRSSAAVTLPNGLRVRAASYQLVLSLDEAVTAAEWDAIQTHLELRGGRPVGQNPALRSITYEFESNALVETSLADTRALGGVAQVSPNLQFELAVEPIHDLGDSPGEYWLTALRAPEAWAMTTGAADVRIGLVDSEYQFGSGHLEASRVGVVSITDVASSSQHGTAIAALIGATGLDGSCATGVAWQSTLISSPVFGVEPFAEEAGESDAAFLTEVEAGIGETIDTGCRLVNLSIAPDLSETPLEEQAQVKRAFRAALGGSVRYAALHDALLVWAAGNDSLEDDAIFPEESSGLELESLWTDHSLVVGASTSDNRIASFSDRGAVVDLFAPGEEIRIGSLSISCELSSGTSLSCALVSGTAGLVLAERPDLSAAQLKQIMVASSRQLRPGGARVLNAFEALLAAQRAPLSPSPVETIELAPSEAAEFVLEYTAPDGAVEPSLDIAFLIDRSETAEAIASSLSSELDSIAQALRAEHPDLRIGVASFVDFPVAPFGSPGDTPYSLEEPLTYLDSRVHTAIERVAASVSGGFDLPESQYEALYQLATGAGLDRDGNGEFDGDLEIVPHEVGFRPGALKIAVLLTDSPFHDNLTEPSYPGVSSTFAQNALADLGVRAVVIGSDLPALALNQSQALATATQGALIDLESGAPGLGDPLIRTIETWTESTLVRLQTRNDLAGVVNQLPEPTSLNSAGTFATTLQIESPQASGLFRQQHRFTIELITESGAVLTQQPIVLEIPGDLSF